MCVSAPEVFTHGFRARISANAEVRAYFLASVTSMASEVRIQLPRATCCGKPGWVLWELGRHSRVRGGQLRGPAWVCTERGQTHCKLGVWAPQSESRRAGRPPCEAAEGAYARQNMSQLGGF